MTFDRDKEISDNLALVTYMIEKYWPKFDEDLFQTGCVGLIKAVDSYDPNRGVKKSTYYGKCILNEIYMSNRKYAAIKNGKNIKHISLNNIIEDNIEYIDLIPDKTNIEEEVIINDEYNTLYSAYNNLNDIDKLIIKYTFGLFNTSRKTQTEIGNLVNMSQASVSKRSKKILDIMRGDMNE